MYLVMEYIKGLSLWGFLEKFGGIPIHRFQRILA